MDELYFNIPRFFKRLVRKEDEPIKFDFDFDGAESVRLIEEDYDKIFSAVDEEQKEVIKSKEPDSKGLKVIFEI